MKNKTYDILGISAATLCLIHCLIFPLLVIIPIGISHNPYIDLAFLIIGAIIAFKICKTTDSKLVIALFAVSLLTILISVVLDALYHIHLPLIYVGSVGLITAHIINHRRTHT
ncbi:MULTISPECIES: MerC domain-containing protein [Flavobacteriales]|uniref:MerC domain-containing protein n=2 Tax=Flavobacteriales TaxID=200644 RepID=A0A501Q7V6_9FLAO|nr:MULTISPECIES: MerC domain-containing protein [Flavobacteriales]AZA58617.1 MerC domain-containing protein [Chryseobacterium shandongense]AZB32458.1 MerC domain-containing protein [Chryseobacterium bernardetii]MCT3807948.1 MerC domain-containing protein [Elizabethkingia anophelis]MCT3825866.1 MerC domain-containing protein [Elizabethkingia anophelis]MCT3836707.1 MerC domain-containing protein [Elizabethkingia anophelis]|eukprot:gene16881-20256_t